MRRPKGQVKGGEDLFVGIDLHKNRWHVTIRTFDVELFSASIPGNWESLQRILARYAGHQLRAVYEAGYFGFRLHDRLVDHGTRWGLRIIPQLNKKTKGLSRLLDNFQPYQETGLDSNRIKQHLWNLTLHIGDSTHQHLSFTARLLA